MFEEQKEGGLRGVIWVKVATLATLIVSVFAR